MENEIQIVSGGAHGADFHWTKCACDAGLCAKVMSFEGHRASTPKDAMVVRLTEEELQSAVPALVNASIALHKSMPSPGGGAIRYLQRDWFIAKDADVLFAIGKKLERGYGIGVDGGTGWTCQMFFNRMKENPSLRMWLYDMLSMKWLGCNAMGIWNETTLPETIDAKCVALIGSRDISTDGVGVIPEVIARLCASNVQ
jgi:hypothetical protein